LFSEIRTAVLTRIKPGPTEVERMGRVSSTLMARIQCLAEQRGLAIKPVLVGSAARGTWLSSDHDLDIFLGVPAGGDLSAALDVARQVADHYEEKYAEHAYVHAWVDGYDVDLVPCYLVADARDLLSAVDRTPLHTRYVSSRIRGREDEVLLLKQFMKGVEVYGSELKVGGFSGYLTELLILFYGSFQAVLAAASKWRPGERLDPEGHGTVEHDEPLIVVDPVDPRRNVAAALTLDKMLLFSCACRSFLAAPQLDFFSPPKVSPISDNQLSSILAERGTMPILIEFEAPAVVEDVLYPQLRKAEESVRLLLDKNGFSVLRSNVSSYRDRAVLLFEMQVWRLPAAARRTGPPVWEAEHLARFLAAHPTPLSGPYVSGGKAVVEEPRSYTLAPDLLKAKLFGLSLGKHLAPALRHGYNIYCGREILQMKDEGFRIFLARFFEARLRMRLL